MIPLGDIAIALINDARLMLYWKHCDSTEKRVLTNAAWVMLCTGDIAIALTNERGLDIPVKTIDNQDNTFRIEFEPTTVGTYTANVFFADQEIPSSPYKIRVEPSVDVGKVMVQGLEDSKFPFTPFFPCPLGMGNV